MKFKSTFTSVEDHK